MLRLSTSCLALLCFAAADSASAGAPGCDCGPHEAHSAPLLYNSPVMHSEPAIQTHHSYGNASAYAGPVDVGNRSARMGNLYGSTGLYGHQDPNSFQSGFESLPNMDGGGVHYRLPFHSYRRPWAHPGIAVKNINIIW